eukprot:COSAG04_NODE_12445_length_652_cov_1.746835_1_plen_152_part_00
MTGIFDSLSSPDALSELCDALPAEGMLQPSGKPPQSPRSAADQEPEPEPEPEGAAEEQPEPGRPSSLGAAEPGGLGAAELEFIAWAGGGVLGTVALALRNGCGDDLCGLTEVLVTILFDGFDAACLSLTQVRFLTEILDDFRRFVDEIWRF